MKLRKKDVELVRAIANVVQNKMINPFTEAKDDLVNISNGKMCASNDLANAKQIGQDALSAAQVMGSSSVKSVKLQTFVDKVIKPHSLVQESKKLYEKEINVTQNLYFLENLDYKEKAETFIHEWTSLSFFRI